MTQRNKSAATGKRKQTRTAQEATQQKGAAGPEAKGRAWQSANKLDGASKRFASRQKLPSGPLGGSGRKTNLARSS